jgi:hypothetical protein
MAACGGALIAFIGVCHESVGSVLFPWGPRLLGGPIGWNGVGILAIGTGLLLLGGTLGLIRFPVVFVALVTVAIGVFFVAFAGVVHHQFHMFALALAIAGAATAYAHPKATSATPAS